MVSQGGKLEQKNDDGFTALLAGCREVRNPDVIKRLLALEADVNARDAQDRTPLMYASMRYSQYNDEGFSPILLTAGARPDAIDNQGNTVLHYTSNLVQRKCLLKAGVDPDLKNKEGLTYEDVYGWYAIY